MIQVQEFVAERAATIAGKVRKARKNSLASAREAARGSAESIKSLRNPVRVVSRSGIKLTTVSQSLSQNLIELQADVVTSAISEFALRLERAAKAETIVDLFRDQIELVPATRARITGDAQRAAQILRDAGRDIRSVATHAFERIAERNDQSAAPKPARRARKSGRKTAGRARKAA